MKRKQKLNVSITKKMKRIFTFFFLNTKEKTNSLYLFTWPIKFNQKNLNSRNTFILDGKGLICVNPYKCYTQFHIQWLKIWKKVTNQSVLRF